MEIVVVSPVPPAADGTSAIPILLDALVRGLAEHHRVVAAFPVAAPEDAHAAGRLAELGVETLTAPRGDGSWGRRIALARARALGPWPWRTAWFHAPELQRRLAALLATRPVDAVILEDAAGVYRVPARLPVLLTDHEVRRAHGPDAPVGRLRQRVLEGGDARRFPAHRRELWRRADLVQVFTREERAAALAEEPDLAGRVRVTPFGLPLPAATPPGDPASRRLLFVGAFAHAPNVDAAAWLAREILPHLPAATLDIAGPEPPPAVLRLAGPRVRVHGAVPSLAPLVRDAAVLVAPVRSGGGMRMKVLHGLASGRPVVTTSLGAEGLDVGGPPPLVVANDAEAMIAAIGGLLDDPARRATLARRGRAHVEAGYGPRAYAARVAANVREAVDLHGARGTPRAA